VTQNQTTGDTIMATSLEHQVQVEQARAEAIKRIEAIMMPGAQALCDAREVKDPYWLERDAPVGDTGITLNWRSQGYNQNQSRSASEAAKSSYGNTPSVQVCCASDVTPEALAQAEVVAFAVTKAILRETAAKRAACETLSAALVRDFATVAAELS
jgi:hypothetical protein